MTNIRDIEQQPVVQPPLTKPFLIGMPLLTGMVTHWCHPNKTTTTTPRDRIAISHPDRPFVMSSTFQTKANIKINLTMTLANNNAAVPVIPVGIESHPHLVMTRLQSHPLASQPPLPANIRQSLRPVLRILGAVQSISSGPLRSTWQQQRMVLRRRTPREALEAYL